MPILNKKSEYVILGGRASFELAQKVAKNLKKKLGKVEYTLFPNQETRIRLLANVQKKTVFIVQSLSAPSDNALWELLLLANAAQKAGAKKIIAIIPWLAYSPQDKIFRSGEALSSSLVAGLIAESGIKEVILLDVHSPENIKHFQEKAVKVHHLSALPIFAKEIEQENNFSSNWLVLRVDKGADERSSKLATLLNLPVLTLEKVRDRKTGMISFKKENFDLKGKKIVSFDDFISTGGSLVCSVQIAKDLGAVLFINCSTHGLLALDASQKIKNSQLDRLYITNSYPVPAEKQFAKMKILDCTPLLSQKIKELISL